MPLLKIKPKVQPSDKLVMIRPRKVAAEVFAKYGATMWLTSGMEGSSSHGDGTLHYAGYAEDYDGSRDFTKQEWQEIEVSVRLKLNDTRYQVIAHDNHLHVEWQPLEFNQYLY